MSKLEIEKIVVGLILEIVERHATRGYAQVFNVTTLGCALISVRITTGEPLKLCQVELSPSATRFLH